MEADKASARLTQQRYKESGRAAAIRRKREASKYATDPKYRIKQLIGKSIRQYIKGGKGGLSTFKLLGYSPEALHARLMATMPHNRTWDDFMQGNLHIDHITPVAAFEFKSVTDPQFKQCYAIENLRLLEAIDNLKKGARKCSIDNGL